MRSSFEKNQRNMNMIKHFEGEERGKEEVKVKDVKGRATCQWMLE